MTNQAYFISLLGFAPSTEVIEAAFIDCGLTSTDVYAAINSTALKTAAITALQMLLSTPDVTQGTGETANAIRYDRNAILERIKMLEKQLGITTDLPTIKGVCRW